MQSITVLANLLKKSHSGFERCVNQITISSIKEGSTLLNLKLAPEHLNHSGNLHDGLPGLLIDMSSCLAFYTKRANENKICLSVNMDIKYTARAKLGDELIISTNLVHSASSFAMFESKILNKLDNKLLIHGGHTMSILDSPQISKLLYS